MFKIPLGPGELFLLGHRRPLAGRGLSFPFDGVRYRDFTPKTTGSFALAEMRNVRVEGIRLEEDLAIAQVQTTPAEIVILQLDVLDSPVRTGAPFLLFYLLQAIEQTVVLSNAQFLHPAADLQGLPPA